MTKRKQFSRIEELYKKIAEVDEQIRIRREALSKAQSSINNNPFYSEATRVGNQARLEQQAQTDIGNFIKQKETYLTELSLRNEDSEKLNVAPVTRSLLEYDASKGILRIKDKTVKFKKDNFRAKLLEILTKNERNRRKIWSWDEIYQQIEGSEPTENKEKRRVYEASKGIIEHIASKVGIQDFLLFNTNTVQINPLFVAI